MSEKTEYEHGARKLMPATGADPNDDFSASAAKNKRPSPGSGLSRTVERPPSETEGAPQPEPTDKPPRDTRDSPAPAPNPNGASGGERSAT